MANTDLQTTLLNFISNADYPEPIEDDIYCRFCDLVIDTLAVSIAGVDIPATRYIIQYARNLNEVSKSPVLIADLTFSPETAACVNGVIAHGVDYDDVTPAWRGHPSAVLLPALLAAGYQLTCTKLEFAKAYTVGYEIGGRIGRTLADSHYQKGWHSTSTIGVIAATAACCHLLELTNEKTANALGFAIAQAGGTRESFGTMGKPVNAGFAAAAAVRAVNLAGTGLSSSFSCLNGPKGFSALYGAGENPEDEINRISINEPLLCTVPIEPKLMPICYAAQRAVIAALHLKNNHHFSASEIHSINVTSTLHSHDALLTRLPDNPVDARFSLEYGVATALIDSAISLNSFSDKSFSRTVIQDLISKIRICEDGELSENRTSRVSIRMNDGKVIEESVSEIGAYHDINSQAVAKKLTTCLEFAGFDDHRDQLVSEITGERDRAFMEILQKPIMAGLRKQARATILSMIR